MAHPELWGIVECPESTLLPLVDRGNPDVVVIDSFAMLPRRAIQYAAVGDFGSARTRNTKNCLMTAGVGKYISTLCARSQGNSLIERQI